MNKRHVFLLTAVLGMAAAQGTPPTTPSASTAVTLRDPQLSSAPVTMNTGSFRGPLSVLLAAIAKSAGYDVVFNFNVDALALIDGGVVANASTTTSTATGNTTQTTATSGPASYASATGKPGELSAKPIAYNFVNKPFNEVWPLLMDLYELQYSAVRVGSGDVLRIGQRPAQLAVPLRNINAPYAYQRALEFFGERIYTELPIRDNTGAVVDKVRQFDGYALTGSLRIVSDTENNRLIVGGTAEETTKVRSFVSTIDVPRTQAATLPQSQVIYTAKGSATDVVAVLKARYPNLSLTQYGASPQIIVSGTKTDVDTALALLTSVDQPVVTGAQTVQRVFQLVNASAEEVKATLEGTLARDLTPVAQPLANVPVNATDASGNAVTVTVPTSSTTAGQAAQTQAAAAAGAAATAAQTGNGATIIADRRTNTLIVRGSSAQVAQISDLIPQLDQVVPQINVQVRIQEVSDQALRTLGLDWKVGFGGFNVSVGSGGLGAAFDPTRSLVGFNIFPTLTALENQSLTKRVYDGSITMQSGQRSLTSASGAQNASGNAAATIKSGGRLEINIPSSAGNIVRQIDYGVNLDFFDPQVAPDGTVTLRVRGQVAQPVNVPTTGVPNIITFTNSEAQSTITFKSGQTILMSGLMGTNESRTTAGVPFLSTLPVIGAAFGNQSTNRTQTQLMVIITGNVVR
jgi:general secretion pathway protein D/type IV pilus assembly protein PilQ